MLPGRSWAIRLPSLVAPSTSSWDSGFGPPPGPPGRPPLRGRLWLLNDPSGHPCATPRESAALRPAQLSVRRFLSLRLLQTLVEARVRPKSNSADSAHTCADTERRPRIYNPLPTLKTTGSSLQTSNSDKRLRSTFRIKPQPRSSESERSKSESGRTKPSTRPALAPPKG